MGSKSRLVLPYESATMIGHLPEERRMVIIVTSRTFPGKLVFPNGRIKVNRETPRDAAVREFCEETPFQTTGRVREFRHFANPRRPPREMTMQKYLDGADVPRQFRNVFVSAVCTCDFAFSAVVQGELPQVGEMIDHDRRHVMLADLREISLSRFAKGHDVFAKLWLESLDHHAGMPAAMAAV